ncbi:MAG: long-chain fatty acid--CoA ligase [Spirochaetes bacterium]|nr:long-chain fatty acid--CoA ligase [Spirochaetota bacterium]
MYQLEKPDNLVEMLEESIARFSANEWFGVKSNNTYTWFTYGQIGKRIDNLRGGLAYLGIGKGDTVGVISNNRVEWAVACYATYGRCARFVPMYEAELVSTWEYIIRDSNIKVLFVSKPDIYEKIKHLLQSGADLAHIIVIEGDGEGSMAGLERIGEKYPIKSIIPHPDDIAGLIYTSGTTGDPKGVLLSHGNISSNIHAILKCFHMLNERDRTLSFLPWAHSYGQVCELHSIMRIGGSYGLAESPATIVNDLALIRPTLLISVPRIFYRVHDAIKTKMNEDGGLPLLLFNMGLKSGIRRRALALAGKKSAVNAAAFAIADRLVFKKIRDKFGGRLKVSITGSAAINPQVAEFFSDVGVPIYEALGMTEASPGVATNTPDYNKFGSCGKAFDKVTLVIDRANEDGDGKEGELVIYGPNVMKGYHNKPEETKQVLTEDGGLRTGDRAFIDDEGFLYITGRIKESFKLENGKYVFPAAIEAEIMMNKYVEQVMICGLNRPYTVCIIVPDFANLEKYAAENNLDRDHRKLVAMDEIAALYEREIQKQISGKIGSYEMPKRYLILPEPFTVDNGMLTQSFKLKRKKVMEKLGAEIEALYAN